MEVYFLSSLLFIVITLSIRAHFINCFKLAYYETTLDINGINIEKVRNIGVIGIIKI